jgi:hypothetical protein
MLTVLPVPGGSPCRALVGFFGYELNASSYSGPVLGKSALGAFATG